MKRAAAAIGVAAALLGGCGAGERSDRAAPGVTNELERIARESRGPVYWLGPSFEGLPLTHSEGPQALPPRPARTVERPSGVPTRPPAPRPGPFFVYGECNGEGEGDSFHCTGPQVQLQHWPIASPSRYPEYFSCTRTTIRGVPAAQFDGFEIYIGDSLIRIYAPTQAHARRAASALRPIDGSAGPSEPLPPPAIDVEQALARCSLDSLDEKLDELRRNARIGLLWVGRRFEQLPLFRAEGDGRSASFMYGGCETPEVAGSCYPPLTIEVTPFADRRPAGWRAVRTGIVACERLRVRGAEAASTPSTGELTLFTGSIAVRLRGPDFRRLRSAADALQPFDGPATAGPLPPPAAEISDELERVCPAEGRS
jgi:hypothetical protein